MKKTEEKTWFQRNLANFITMCRFALTSVLLWYVIWHRDLIWVIFTLGLIAAVTDGLDGYVARKKHIVSAFGKASDRLADKYLQFTMYAFIILDVRIAIALKIMAWILGAVEVGLTVTWLLALLNKTEISAGKWGKRKMIAVCVGVLACPAVIIAEKFGVKISFCTTPIIFCILVLSAILGVMSFWRHSQQLVGELLF